MKVLVTGCNGLLGQNLLRAAGATGMELAGMGIEPEPLLSQQLSGGYQKVDLGDRAALLSAVEKSKPDFIINAAAMTDVDACERNPELNDRINRDMTAALKSPDVIENLKARGIDAAPNSPAEFGAFIRAESVKWRPIVQQSGIKPDGG